MLIADNTKVTGSYVITFEYTEKSVYAHQVK